MKKERADQTAENWRVRNDKARFGERALKRNRAGCPDTYSVRFGG
jgi:hypothetical protein